MRSLFFRAKATSSPRLDTGRLGWTTIVAGESQRDGDRLEPRDGIVGLVAQHRADHQLARGAEQYRVAVGGRTRRCRRANRAAAAAHVFDIGRAEQLGDLAGPFAADDIDNASRRARHDELDRALGIGRLRARASRNRGRHNRASAELQQLSPVQCTLLSVRRRASRCRGHGSAPADRPNGRCRRRASARPADS